MHILFAIYTVLLHNQISSIWVTSPREKSMSSPTTSNLSEDWIPHGIFYNFHRKETRVAMRKNISLMPTTLTVARKSQIIKQRHKRSKIQQKTWDRCLASKAQQLPQGGLINQETLVSMCVLSISPII